MLFENAEDILNILGWEETVSFDELEVFDFDALLEQIDQFSQSFNKDKP